MAHTLKVYPTIQNIWCLTDVTRPDLEMSESFIREYKIQLQDTYERLADSQSKRNFISYLNAKISGDTTWILRDFQGPSTYFDCDILSLDTYENYLDLGAYDGSSMEAFIAAIRKAGHSEYRIIAIEVQEKMYQLLCERYRDNSRVSIFNRGISDHSGVDRFNIDDQSTCLSSEGGVEMEVTTVDDLCKSVKGITTVKICIGSTIIPILSGAKETIAQSLPKLIISAGIDKRALIDYIPCLENISGGNRYKYYLRFTNAMTEALVLYAIPA